MADKSRLSLPATLMQIRPPIERGKFGHRDKSSFPKARGNKFHRSQVRPADSLFPLHKGVIIHGFMGTLGRAKK